MKQLILIVTTTLLLVACNSTQKKRTESTVSKVQDLSIVIRKAEVLVDKEVHIKGWVDHVCKHGGKRALLQSEDGKSSIKVEAGEKIGSFNNEVSGKQIAVIGILKERKITIQQIDEWQERLENVHKEEGKEQSCNHSDEGCNHGDHAHGHEHKKGESNCHSQLNQVNEMRTWMKDNNKDYYPVYYVEGKEFSEVNE